MGETTDIQYQRNTIPAVFRPFRAQHERGTNAQFHLSNGFTAQERLKKHAF